MVDMIYIMFIFLLLICVIIYLICSSHSTKRTYSGSAEHNGESVLYHGSNHVINILEPRPSSILNGETAVFGTPSYTDAVIFGTSSKDYDIALSYSRKTDTFYLVEQYPDALDIINKTVYVHHLPTRTFYKDSRATYHGEVISKTAVTPIKYDTVNASEYLHNAKNVILMKYRDYCENVKPYRMLTKAEEGCISKVYVPISKFWHPKLDETSVVVFDGSPTQLKKDLKKYSPKNKAILVCDIFEGPLEYYSFGNVDMFILTTDNVKHNPSGKHINERFDKYAKYRTRLLTKLGCKIIKINDVLNV